MSEETPRKPSHLAYQVSEAADGKAHFNRIGAAFRHRDGEGFNIQLESVPVDPRADLSKML